MTATPLHVMLVASDEAAADALHAAFGAQRSPQLRIVGAASLADAAIGITAFAPHVICAPEALRGHLGGLSVPVVYVAAGADPVAAVLAAQRPPTPAAATPPSAPVPPPPARSAPAPLALPPLTSGVRAGFWGRRGGVGTTRTAILAARLLAYTGRKVVLCDVAERGDVQLYFQLSPVPEPVVTAEGIHLWWGLPQEAALDAFEGIILDGGRQARTFNVSWHGLTAPLQATAVARLLGLPEAVGEAWQAATPAEREVPC